MKIQPLHSSPRTRGLHCDGKPCFEVLQRRKNMRLDERYWCTFLRGYFNPRDYDETNCPRDNKQEIKKSSFNRGRL